MNAKVLSSGETAAGLSMSRRISRAAPPKRKLCTVLRRQVDSVRDYRLRSNKFARCRRKNCADERAVDLRNDLDVVAVFRFAANTEIEPVFNFNQRKILSVWRNNRVSDVGVGDNRINPNFLNCDSAKLRFLSSRKKRNNRL
jgi:hypothetical protein